MLSVLRICSRHVLRIFEEMDIIIMCAAVADYHTNSCSQSKNQKSKIRFSIELEKTVDIFAHLGKIKKPNQILVGFALETQDEENYAKGKLEKKNLDLIVLNSLNDKGAGFKSDTNKITIFNKALEKTVFERKIKTKLQRIFVMQY